MHDTIVDLAELSGLEREEVRLLWEKAKVETTPRGRGAKPGTVQHIEAARKLLDQKLAPHVQAFAVKKAQLNEPTQEFEHSHEEE